MVAAQIERDHLLLGLLESMADTFAFARDGQKWSGKGERFPEAIDVALREICASSEFIVEHLRSNFAGMDLYFLEHREPYLPSLTFPTGRIVKNAFRDKSREIDEHKAKLKRMRKQLDRCFSSHFSQKLENLENSLNEIKHNVQHFIDWSHRMDSHISLSKNKKDDINTLIDVFLPF